MKLSHIFSIVVCMSAGTTIANAQMAGAPGPHLLVYKTKKNYRTLVPILLTDDKKSIITYPDPQDIRLGGSDIIPAKLKQGYLMDNRGIGENVAFLNISYKKYGKLKTAPTITQLQGMIKDSNPLVVLYDCGLKQSYKDPVAEINKLISNDQLPGKCKVLKQAETNSK